MKNLFAYTPPAVNYPPFISVNEMPNGDVTFTVRSIAYELGYAGPTAEITLSKEQAKELARNLLDALNPVTL